MKIIFCLLTLALAMSCSTQETKTPPGITSKVESIDGAMVTTYVKGAPNKTLFVYNGLGCNQWLGTCPFMPGQDRTFEADFLAKVQDAIVVNIWFDVAWLYDPTSPKTLANPQATVDNFKRYLAASVLPRPYYGVGHSQGGFNLAQVCQFMDKCVFAHPMFITDDPYADNGIIDEAQCFLKKGLQCLAGPQFIAKEITKDHWPSADPLRNPKNIPSLVMICLQDQFNLIAGPRQYVKNAQAKGYPVSKKEYSGCDHFTPSADTVLAFLLGTS